VLCNLGTMSDNQTIAIDITYRSRGSNPVVINCATVRSDTYDINPQN
jgi:hypothetical protein